MQVQKGSTDLSCDNIYIHLQYFLWVINHVVMRPDAGAKGDKMSVDLLATVLFRILATPRKQQLSVYSYREHQKLLLYEPCEFHLLHWGTTSVRRDSLWSKVRGSTISVAISQDRAQQVQWQSLKGSKQAVPRFSNIKKR